MFSALFAVLIVMSILSILVGYGLFLSFLLSFFNGISRVVVSVTLCILTLFVAGILWPENIDTPSDVLLLVVSNLIYVAPMSFLVLNIMDQVRERILNETEQSNKADLPILKQLLQKKTAENRITYISLFFAFVGEYVLYTTTQTSIRWMMILTVFLLTSNFIKQRILKYRVEHDLYGTCYSEAKEIVSFILEWYRENGDSNSKPPKLVFTQEEIDECLQVNGGEEYAG